MTQTIRRLSDTTINRIAAGEVIDRPASVVKELVENALDAGATQIRIDIARGGKSLLRVHDNGHGISEADLPLSVERHATSKLDEADIFAIAHLGFRGEALASIGSVARLTITSRTQGAEAWTLTLAGGRQQPLRPIAHPVGTTVEVRDLFYATPARLKFLGSDRAETMAITDMVRRLALSAPDIGIALHDHSTGEPRTLFDAPIETGDLIAKGHNRVARVLGRSTMEGCLHLDVAREGARLHGWIGQPQTTRATAQAQFFFVNGRNVRDKTLAGALKGAYQDLLERGQHAVAVLFLEVAPERVDVNVHPAKAEVRFREAGEIRGLLVAGIRAALAQAGHRPPEGATLTVGAPLGGASAGHPHTYQVPYSQAFLSRTPTPDTTPPTFDPTTGEVVPDPLLGRVVAYLYDAYALSHTPNGYRLINTKALQERLIYAQLLHQAASAHPDTHNLVLPVVVELTPAHTRHLEKARPTLAALGFVVEPFGGTGVLVRGLPACTAEHDPTMALTAALDALDTHPDTTTAMATGLAQCPPSTPAHPLGAAEIEALLRAAAPHPETTADWSGAPTARPLTRADLDRLFQP